MRLFPQPPPVGLRREDTCFSPLEQLSLAEARRTLDKEGAKRWGLTIQDASVALYDLGEPPPSRRGWPALSFEKLIRCMRNHSMVMAYLEGHADEAAQWLAGTREYFRVLQEAEAYYATS